MTSHSDQAGSSKEGTASRDQALLELLVCPVDHTRLDLDAGTLVCPVCGRRFPIEDGVPNMLVDEG